MDRADRLQCLRGVSKPDALETPADVPRVYAYKSAAAFRPRALDHCHD